MTSFFFSIVCTYTRWFVNVCYQAYEPMCCVVDVCVHQGRSFAKQVVGAEPVKTAQSAITILEFQISPGFDTLSR